MRKVLILRETNLRYQGSEVQILSPRRSDYFNPKLLKLLVQNRWCTIGKFENRLLGPTNTRLLPSSQAALRPPGPLRTGREGFPSSSSSPSNATLVESGFETGKTRAMKPVRA